MSEEIFSQVETINSQASTIQNDYDAAVQSITNDSSYSDEGKLALIDDAEKQRQRALDAVQSDAQSLLDKAAQIHQQAAVEHESAAIARKRSVLGDSLLMDLRLRQAAAMPVGDVIELVTAAQEHHSIAKSGDSEFMAELMIEIGQTLIVQRADDPAIAGLQRVLNKSDDSPHDLANFVNNGATWTSGLDRGAYRNQIADVFGVDASHVAI